MHRALFVLPVELQRQADGVWRKWSKFGSRRLPQWGWMWMLITDIRQNQVDYGSGVFVVMLVLVMVLECTCPEWMWPADLKFYWIGPLGCLLYLLTSCLTLCARSISCPATMANTGNGTVKPVMTTVAFCSITASRSYLGVWPSVGIYGRPRTISWSKASWCRHLEVAGSGDMANFAASIDNAIISRFRSKVFPSFLMELKLYLMIGDTYWILSILYSRSIFGCFFFKGSFRCMFYVFFPGKITSASWFGIEGHPWKPRWIESQDPRIPPRGAAAAAPTGTWLLDALAQRHSCGRSRGVEIYGNHLESEHFAIFWDVDHRIWYLISLLPDSCYTKPLKLFEDMFMWFSLSWRSFGVFLYWLYDIISIHLRYFCSWQIPWEEYLQRTENWSDGDGKDNGFAYYDICLASSGRRSQYRQ